MKFISNKYSLLLLATITFVVFSPTLFNDFQRGWDDQWQVLDYTYVTNHSFNDLLYHFTHYHLNQYFPVNTLLYIAAYELFGFNPAAFHSASLIIHVTNVLLLFLIVRTALTKVKPTWTVNRIQLFSFVTALIFAVHPLQVESVAWISASKVVLYAMFFLLGLWFYLKYLNSMNYWWLTAVAFCYLLAYGSKEQAIIFPLNLLIFDYIYNRYRNISLSVASLKSRVVLEKVPFFIIAALLYLFSISNNMGTFSGDTYPLYQRMMFGMSSFMDYIFRFIAPVKLYYFYFFPIEKGETLPLFYWIYPLLVLITVAFVWLNYKRNNRIVIFGFLLFLINIVLVLHIVPMPRKMITADRYMYFSIIGLAIMVAWFLNYLYIKPGRWKKYILPAITVWVILLSIHSFIRTTEWKDSEAIKRNITELIEKRKANKQPVVNNPLNLKHNEEE